MHDIGLIDEHGKVTLQFAHLIGVAKREIRLRGLGMHVVADDLVAQAILETHVVLQRSQPDRRRKSAWLEGSMTSADLERAIRTIAHRLYRHSYVRRRVTSLDVSTDIFPCDGTLGCDPMETAISSNLIVRLRSELAALDPCFGSIFDNIECRSDHRTLASKLRVTVPQLRSLLQRFDRAVVRIRHRFEF